MGTETGYGFVLSDPTTQRQFHEPKIAFDVYEIRDYKKVLAYVSDEYEGLIYMAVFKPQSFVFQPRIYYLDSAGSLDEKREFSTLLNECGNDLADHIEAIVQDGHERITRAIHWHKKGHSFSLNKSHIIAEYTTKDDKTGQNLCLIDWKGDNKTGKLEVWYGQKVKKREVRLFRFPINYAKTC